MNHLLSPIITEKSMLAAANGVYTFACNLTSSKSQIKQEVESIFSVHVTRITTSIKKTATRRTGRRRLPASNVSQKTARVWLKKGESIDLFDLTEGN